MNASFKFARHRVAQAAAWACLPLVLPAWAQSSAPATVATTELPQVVITGNPLGSRDPVVPSAALSGDGLVIKRGSTLGDTLGGLPGVASTYFGPNANRPVIRGQDGDRIRLLSNSSATLDASSLSFDHAVPIDPLVVERLEVLRGPAALLYGGSAVGGVVNAIDNRIPGRVQSQLDGAAELKFGGAARERGASAVLNGGSEGFALHADAFWRKTDDLRVPAFDRPLEGGGSESRTRVVNSAGEAKGGALGGGLVWNTGHLGASLDTYRNTYGVVVEDDVTIKMNRDRFALGGEARELGTFIETLRGQVAHTDYEHQELEGTGEVGTTFNNKGTDLRVEAVHEAFTLGSGKLQGVVGVQAESARFSALGEEAFVPNTRTRSSAVFVFEEWSLPDAGKLSAGLRAERARVSLSGDAPDAPELKFGLAATRDFTPLSAALGSAWRFAPQWQLTGNLAYTERAPTSYELYANGVHVATAAFERGDVGQRLEKGTSVDAGVQWTSGAHALKLSLFTSRFSNYIALSATGEPDFVNDEGEAFPVYAFEGVRARLHGAEVEGTWRVLEGAHTLDLTGQLDAVRGDNRTRGEPLPRIAPLRATLGADWQSGPWAARAEVQHSARQSRVPADDVATPAWTMLNLGGSLKLTSVGFTDALLFAKATNLTNERAFSATSIRTVRELSLLPGRGLSVGARVTF